MSDVSIRALGGANRATATWRTTRSWDLDISGTAADQLDAADPEPGYESFGGFGFSAESSFFGAWVPWGACRWPTPPGIGRVIPEGADVLLQMHYGPSAVEESDLSSEVNVFFSEEPIEREVITAIMGPQHLPAAPFVLPPDEVSAFHGTMPVHSQM